MADFCGSCTRQQGKVWKKHATEYKVNIEESGECLFPVLFEDCVSQNKLQPTLINLRNPFKEETVKGHYCNSMRLWNYWWCWEQTEQFVVYANKQGKKNPVLLAT